MDQAASVISTLDSALYVTFFPKLSAELIRLPTTLTNPPAVFVIANSLVVSDKAVSAKTQYNLRVVETLVGARVLAKELGVSVGEKEKVTYREVLGRWAGEADEELNIAKLQDVLEKILVKCETLKPVREAGNTELGVTLAEMISLSDLSEAAFHELYLSWVEGSSPPPSPPSIR
jgi:galactokinase